uniref:Uncharacterized protein n=1 Tax=Cannabis sativa TaxID=3483 RepID=A0A803P350_CANSA
MTTQARKSKTPQDPTVTFEVEFIESKVKSIGAYVGNILKSCVIKYKKGCHVRFVAPGEFSYFPLERVIREECGSTSTSGSSRIGAWSLEHIKDGAILPLREYFREFCNYLRIALFQLIPSSYRILAYIKVLYQIMGWECLTPLEILYFYSVKAVPARKRGLGGFYYLGTHTNDRRIIQVPVPADEEDRDYVARIHFLRNVSPQEAKEEASQDNNCGWSPIVLRAKSMNFENLFSRPSGSKKGKKCVVGSETSSRANPKLVKRAKKAIANRKSSSKQIVIELDNP